MFFFPFGTDAPIYHWPIVTVLMIVLNVVIFALTGHGMETWFPKLEFNELNPVQWLTCNFRHADAMHLIGNMLFLWPFGLVTEGKLGWWRFLFVYLGIGVIFGAVIQLAMYALGSDRSALGASAVIFGLLALCVVWAPKNDLKLFYVFVLGFYFRTGVWEISILAFSGMYVGWEVVMFGLAGFQVSSALLHLVGFPVGFPLGLALLKLRVVDCEGWDLLAVWSGKLHTLPDTAEVREQSEAVHEKYVAQEQAKLKQHQESAVGLIKHHLDEGRPAVAYAVYAKHSAPGGGAWLAAPQLAALATAVIGQKMWPEAISLLRRLAADYPEQSSAARLKLAQILIQVEHRPQQALAVLDKLPATLPEAQAQRRDQLQKLAQQAVDEGSLEMATEDW